MKTFAVKISIRSTPECIWALLTDAPGYPRRNNTIENIEINRGSAFPVRVAEFEPSRRMIWKGGMPKLFMGERTFSFEPGPHEDVEFSMREICTGPMAPLMSRSIPDLHPAFDEFADDLKRAAQAN